MLSVQKVVILGQLFM